MILTYEDLKKIHTGVVANEIPKYIFRTGPMSREDLPFVMIDLYNETIASNPGYSFFYFSDIDCYNFILEEWGEEYAKCYLKIIPSAYRADLFRYLLLYNYGGCYGDFSQKMYITYDELCGGVNEVFCKDTGSDHIALYNALMCSYPNNPIIKKAIDICVDNIENNRYGGNSLDVTGPMVLGRAYREHRTDGQKVNYPIEIGIFNKTKIVMNPGFQNQIIDVVLSKTICDKKIAEHGSIVYQNGEYYNTSWSKRQIYGEYIPTTYINDLFVHYNSSKLKFNYDEIYHSLFHSISDNVENVLEIGFESPNALKIWKNYFLKAKIYGITNDKSISINIDRIKAYHSSYLDYASLTGIVNDMNCKLDIIIDNTNATVEEHINTLEVFLPYLKEGGTYMIEGVNLNKSRMLHFYNNSRFIKLLEDYKFKLYHQKDDVKVITLQK
jgi:hypothetical protein